MPQGANVTREATDVVVAGYTSVDAARVGYAAVAAAAKAGTPLDGVALVSKAADDSVTVEETGDHLVEEGIIGAGGVGLVVGLFAPPLLLATAVGILAGATIAELVRSKVKSTIEDEADRLIRPGGGGVVVACPKSSAADFVRALAHADEVTVGEAEGGKVHALRQALSDAERQIHEVNRIANT